jgi:hypothetical protein
MKTILEGKMAIETEKEMCLRQAKDAAQKAVEFLEMRAVGMAKAELLNALAALEKVYKLARPQEVGITPEGSIALTK